MKKRIREVVTNPLFSGSAVMIIGSNMVSFINYLYHLIMGRMLGPANYGELAAIVTLMGLLGMIPASLNLVVMKYISMAKDDIEVAALISWLKARILLASTAFGLLILIAAPILSSFLNIKTYYLIIVAVSFLFSLQSLLNRSILQGLLKFKEMVLSMMVENSVKVLVSILLIYLGFQVGGAMVALFIAIVLGWYITYLYLKNYKKAVPQTDIHLKEMLMFTLPVVIQSVAITSIYSSDVILVKHFFSSHDAGIYASLSTLGKIIFFGAGPIGAVMFPLVSKRKANGQPYSKIFIYSVLMTILLAVSILALYYFAPVFAIKLLYGSAYIEAANLLIWFGIFISLFTVSYLLINYSLSLGKTKVVYLPLCAAILQIIMILLFHQTLFTVVFISTIISALLLVSLLIYSSHERRRLSI